MKNIEGMGLKLYDLFNEDWEKGLVLGRIEQPLYSQLRIKLITKCENKTYINVMRPVRDELNNEIDRIIWKGKRKETK